MPLRAAVTIAALALPGAALADTLCLTPDSIKGGVTVTVKGGGTQTYRAKGKDVQAEVPVLAGDSGFVAELMLAGGLHVIADHRTEHETGNAQAVLDGDLGAFMEAYLKSEANLP